MLQYSLCLVLMLTMLASSNGQSAGKDRSKDDVERRLSEINELLKKDPKNIEALESKVASLLLLGRFDEGLSVCDEALKIRSDRGYLWFFKGYCNYKREKWEEALKFFDLAYRNGNTNSLEYTTLCLLELKRNSECIEVATKGIQRHPEFASLYFSRGLARKYLKQPMDVVCADMKKAAELKPSLMSSYQRNCLREEGN